MPSVFPAAATPGDFKGLIPAVAQVFPAAEHRYCIRHIHENMKSRWKGAVYKNLLWEAASATTPQKHERAMQKILKENKELHAYLQTITAKQWSRAFFSERPRCDVLLNNLCESLNNQLVHARDKPIVTCLELIREYLMKRIVIVHRTIEKSAGPLTPKATVIFDKIKAEAEKYTAIWCGNGKYQVDGPELEKRAVNMNERSCGCRRFHLTGMPCRHAVACIYNMGLNGIGDGVPEHWVDQCYWLDTWKRVYAHTIEPINGKDMWIPSQCPTTLVAPKYHKPAGRPKTKRKKSAAELEEIKEAIKTSSKLPRKGATVTCKSCGEKGHNKRTCKKSASVQSKAVLVEVGGSDSQAAGSSQVVGDDQV